jgi:hypothetical protein
VVDDEPMGGALAGGVVPGDGVPAGAPLPGAAGGFPGGADGTGAGTEAGGGADCEGEGTVGAGPGTRTGSGTDIPSLVVGVRMAGGIVLAGGAALPGTVCTGRGVGGGSAGTACVGTVGAAAGVTLCTATRTLSMSEFISSTVKFGRPRGSRTRTLPPSPSSTL